MIKKNLFYNALLAVSQFIFPLITFPYSSRILGPNGIGSVNFIDSFTQYFLLFSALGVPLYGVREIAGSRDNPEKLAKIFNEILLIHLISTCIFSVIYVGLALSVQELRGHMDMVAVGVLIMFSNVFLIEWFYQGIENFSYITARSLIVRTLSVIFLFAFLKPGSNPIIYYLISASGYYVTSILNMFYIKKHVKIKLSKLNLRDHLKPLVIILSSTLAVSVYLLMDNIILGFIKDEKAVGFYSTAIRIVKIPFTIIVAISSVIIPQVSQAFKNNDEDKIRLLIHKSFSFICLFGIPITAGIFISASFLVHKFAGEKFTESIVLVQILSPIILLVGLNNIFGFQILTPMGKEKYLLWAVIIGMIFSVTVNLLLIPVLSYKGAAITNLLTECIVTIACYLYVSRFFKVWFNLKVALQCTFGAALFFPIAYLIRSMHLNYNITEIGIIFICGIFYVVYVNVFMNNEYVISFKQSVFNKFSSYIK